MSKYIKLPDSLKVWKINELISEKSGVGLHKVSKKNYDGSVVMGRLRHIQVSGDLYNGDSVAFFQDEVAFLNSISRMGDGFNYIEVVAGNEPAKEKYDLYIITEDLLTLADIMKSKSFNETETIDFGIQMSSLLEKLEANNIFHGNIKPDNIYLTQNGKYKLGGFLDCESIIDDMSFAAPEIYRKENPDFTTDIYSIGMIMYAMSNNNRLPFENKMNKKDALNERLSGKPVSAPENGNDKLKSVIVIACQPDKNNRWKNAGNIKNALSSINDNEFQHSPNVIPPASTDFSDNVFEEYEYEGSDAPNANNYDTTEGSNGFEVIDVSDIENTSPNDIESTKIISFKKPENDSDFAQTKDFNAVTDENVFDTYEVSSDKKVLNKSSLSGDYGKYFDDEDETANEADNNSEESFTNFNDEPKRKGKGKKAAIISACVVLILAIAGFSAFFILNNNGFFGKNGIFSGSTIDEPMTTIANSVQSKTEAAATQPETVAKETKTVLSVIGYYYTYAKQILEDEGFTVEFSDYQFSSEYEENLIISQTPEGSSNAPEGSVIKLVVSKGPNTEIYGEDEYILPYSNTSYLSYEQISSLSDYELQMAINEIYARRGRIYQDEDLNSYFTSKSWYNGIYTKEEFDENVIFNDFEEYNLNLLINERATR